MTLATLNGRTLVVTAILLITIFATSAIGAVNFPLTRLNGARTTPFQANEYGLWLAFWAPNRAWYNIEVENTPWRLDFFALSATHLGSQGGRAPYYSQGPHMIERYPGGREAYYSSYLESVGVFIEREVPVDFSGFIPIDAEQWSPIWTGFPNNPSNLGRDADDYDQIDDWRDYIREFRADQLVGLSPEQQEEVFRQTWLAATRDFFTRLFQRVKQLRPNAKIGFYNIPIQSYWEWRVPTMAARWRWAYENEISWLWEMVDAVFPSIYPFYESVPNGSPVPPGYFDRYQDFEQYFRDNINEAIRHAHGKPVIPYVGYQFHGSNPTSGWMPVTPWMMRRSLSLPRELGCSGVILFAFPNSQSQFDASVPFFRDVINPAVRELAALPSLALTLNPPRLSAPNTPINPPANSNSGGGSSGGSSNPAPQAPPSQPAPEVPPALITPIPPDAPTTPRGGIGRSLDNNQPPLPDPRAVLGDGSNSSGGTAAGSAAPAAAPTAKSGSGKLPSRAVAKTAPTVAAPQGVQSVREAGGDTVFSSEPPIVISSTGQVLADSKDPYASALARVLETATGDTGGSTRASGSSAIAAALARQQSGVFGTSNPTIVYQSSKPKPTVAPNKDKVITSVPTPP